MDGSPGAHRCFDVIDDGGSQGETLPPHMWAELVGVSHHSQSEILDHVRQSNYYVHESMAGVSAMKSIV